MGPSAVTTTNVVNPWARATFNDRLVPAVVAAVVFTIASEPSNRKKIKEKIIFNYLLILFISELVFFYFIVFYVS
jgi:hypothetical protein